MDDWEVRETEKKLISNLQEESLFLSNHIVRIENNKNVHPLLEGTLKSWYQSIDSIHKPDNDLTITLSSDGSNTTLFPWQINQTD